MKKSIPIITGKAKRAVEIAIEQDEETAMRYIEEQISEEDLESMTERKQKRQLLATFFC